MKDARSDIEAMNLPYILIVEDDKGVNHLIERKLRLAGYRTVCVFTGCDAITEIARDPNVVMLLDYQLPDLTGKEVVERMRHKGIYVPFITMTGCGDEKTAITMMKLGALEYIVKEADSLDSIPQIIKHVIDDLIMHRRLAKSEKALHESEFLYKTLVETTNTGYVIVDTQGLVIDANPEYVRLTGHGDLEEIRGKSVLDWSAPYEKKRNEDAVRKCMAEGRISNLELDYIDSAGKIAPVEINATMVVREGIPQIITLVRDISRWKNAEEALRSSEARLREAQEMGNIGNWEFDLATGRIEWSDEVYRIFHRDKTIGPPTSEEEAKYYIPEDGKRIREYARDVMENGRELRYDITAKLPEGQKIFLSSSMRPIRDETGRIIKLFGTVQDITARRQAEESLRRSEEKFRRLFDESPSGIALTDAHGVILEVNRSLLGLTSIGRERLIGQNFLSLAAKFGLDGQEQLADFQKMLSGETAVNELTYRRQDGRQVMISIRSARLAIDEKSAGVLFMVDDITAMKEKEKLEDQLRQAQKIEAIGQLAGGVAHDFNNFLGGISGFADLLRMRLDPGTKLCGYAERITILAMKAADVTRKLLTFARRTRIEMKPIDVHGCIKQTIEVLQHTIDRRIQIQCSLLAENSAVRGDTAELENALLNLGINARDAIPEGGMLTFKTKNVDLESSPVSAIDGLPMPTGSCIEVTIADTGVGMDDAALKRMFEPFFTTKEVGKGTGLGLASVYGCIRQHNGYIEVKSARGTGTTFTIFLPLLAKEELTVGSKEPMEPVKGTGTVLVIDDEEYIRSAASDFLKSMGYNVKCCENGEDAVACYQESRTQIDAVLLDLIMSEMSGLDCFRALKQINPDVIVIVESGYADEKGEKWIMSEGAKAFIRKPFGMADLSRVLSQALQRKL